MVGLAVGALVAALAALALFHAVDRARQRSTMTDMHAIAQALDSYIAEHRRPPAAEGPLVTLEALLVPRHSARLPLTDHWSHPYRYASDGREGYTLESFGKDGSPGDDVTLATRFDFDRDIVLANGRFVAAPE